jgi:hypothetical protein
MSDMLGGIMGGGGGGNIFGMVGGIVGGIFGGPMGAMIGKALGNMIGEAVGDAVKQSVDTLKKENGLPGFLADEIKKMVDEKVAEKQDKSVDCECQNQVNDETQGAREDFIKDMVKMILDFVKEALQQQGGQDDRMYPGGSRDFDESGGSRGSGGSQGAGGADGSQGSGSSGNLMDQLATDGAVQMGGAKGKSKTASAGGSWYEILAEALGKALDAQAAKVEELGNKVNKLNDTIKADPNSGTKDASKASKDAETDKPSVMTELQAASQKLSFMMSAANDVLKTIGQALGEMARKQ